MSEAYVDQAIRHATLLDLVRTCRNLLRCSRIAMPRQQLISPLPETLIEEITTISLWNPQYPKQTRGRPR